MKSGKGSLLQNGVYLGIGLASATAAMVIARAQRKAQWASGKVVVITGGSRGLGLALAEEFAQRGARLVLAARDEAELERARFQLIERGLVRGEHLQLVAADLRDSTEAVRLIGEATKRFGRVDLLINNAGVITVGPVQNQTLEQFREVMESNFYTGLHCTMAVLPQMLGRGEGSIANIASIGGRVAVPHLLPYTASKFAVVGFSEGLGMELRSKGIRVTTICPGLMRTGSHRNAIFTGDAEREYRWFSTAANLPGASASASAAARKIANGIAIGAAEITITPQAWLAARFGNLSPELKRLVMAGALLMLPDAVEGYPEGRRGEDVRGRELLPARTIGSYAARRYNETSAYTERERLVDA